MHALRLGRINPQTGAPRWFQIKEDLRRAIVNGTYSVGEQLPTEVQLMEHYGVSRITVRAALDHLVQEGLIERGSGRGTFVRTPVVEQPVLTLAGFHDDMRARGLRPGSRTVGVAWAIPPGDVLARLELPSGKCLLVERVLLADEAPMAFHRSWLPPWVLGQEGPPSSAELDAGSLYDILDRRSGSRPQRAEETIEAQIADETLAALLAIRPGDPILMAHRLSFDRRGRPVEYVDCAYRADRYRYRVELSR